MGDNKKTLPRPQGRKRIVATKRAPKRQAARKRPLKIWAFLSLLKAKPARKKKVVRKKAHKSKPSQASIRKVGFMRRMLRAVMRFFWVIFSRCFIAGSLVCALVIAYLYSTLPEYEALFDGRAHGSVTMLDREGQAYAWRGEQFGGYITTDTVSDYLKHAIVATEDKRFYKHLGVSPRGIASAIRINMREGRGPLSGHGGSTLTQQTAKLLCLGVPYDPQSWKNQAAYESDCRRGTLARKLKEMFYAVAMELRYSKDEILSIYMNRAYLGAGANGFEAAAQRYFGRSSAEVNIAQSAMLAGLLTAPSRYAPTNNLKRSQERAGVVLLLLNQQGYISDQERADAKAHPATLSEAAKKVAGGYFADWVMGAAPDFLTRETTEDVIIKTTFDPKIQTAAEEAMTWVFDNKVREGSKAQAAIVVMSADGAVRAMVGGRALKVSGEFNRAVQAKRQPGSAFKPFVFATALEMGSQYNSVIVDEPITLQIAGSKNWSPQNYDRKFHGPVTLTEALQSSYNIPAVKLMQQTGVENSRTVAQMFGIESDLAQGPALALGVSETTLLELTGAYAGILNGGTSVTPYGLTSLRLQGDTEPLMGQEGGLGERVITPNSARQLIYMMHQVVERGTGQRAKVPHLELAGKSGTTQAARDAWFVGFSADYVIGVWMGYDDNRSLKGVTGGGLPAEIWQRTMAQIHKDLPNRPLPMIRPDAYPQVPREPEPNAQSSDPLEGAFQNIFDKIFGR